MNQTTTVITEIVAFILGRKYYANIIHTRGTNKCEVSSFIFRSKSEADSHRDALDGNLSYKFVETVSFRSRREYFNTRNAFNKR
ncbi:MAG: hypothetical protein K2L28_07965 [Muribaculaceae bacterium]|nr:hypothetical protein [Muribaculaceae bacterium]